jgi:hypothetical protein
VNIRIRRKVKKQPSRWAVLFFEHRKWAAEHTEWCEPECGWHSDKLHDEQCHVAQNTEVAYLERGKARMGKEGWD